MTTRPTLSMAVTPCPNDTFVIGALATGRVRLPNAAIELELHDIEHLNQAALAGRHDVVKVSCALYGQVADEYEILDTGAALASGYGPMVLGRQTYDRRSIARARVVAPGANTTAALLFRLWAGPDVPLWFAPYHEIIARVAAGEFDAGVIIHESRFTFSEQGLLPIADLGDWWRRETGRPLALGCYLIRRTLLRSYGAAMDRLLREAMRLAAAGDTDIEAYIRRHAQEMDEAVIRRHIALYVNHYTRHLGEAGRDAILYLVDRCREQRLAS